jgi:hypothetical protein
MEKSLIDELREGVEFLKARREIETIVEETLKVLPYSYVNSHKGENIPEMVKEWVARATKAEEELDKQRRRHLDPRKPICTKCKRNLLFYDGWNCYCALHEEDKSCWINFNEVRKHENPEARELEHLRDENELLRKLNNELRQEVGEYRRFSENDDAGRNLPSRKDVLNLLNLKDDGT